MELRLTNLVRLMFKGQLGGCQFLTVQLRQRVKCPRSLNVREVLLFWCDDSQLVNPHIKIT